MDLVVEYRYPIEPETSSIRTCSRPPSAARDSAWKTGNILMDFGTVSKVPDAGLSCPRRLATRGAGPDNVSSKCWARILEVTHDDAKEDRLLHPDRQRRPHRRLGAGLTARRSSAASIPSYERAAGRGRVLAFESRARARLPSPAVLRDAQVLSADQRDRNFAVSAQPLEHLAAPLSCSSSSVRPRDPGQCAPFLGRSVAPVVDVLVPGRRREAVVDLDHRDAARHRADDLAEVAADALGLVDDRHAASPLRIRVDALVRAVVAGDHAELAADALVGVDLRDGLVVEVEIAPLGEAAARPCRRSSSSFSKPCVAHVVRRGPRSCPRRCGSRGA